MKHPKLRTYLLWPDDMEVTAWTEFDDRTLSSIAAQVDPFDHDYEHGHVLPLERWDDRRYKLKG